MSGLIGRMSALFKLVVGALLLASCAAAPAQEAQGPKRIALSFDDIPRFQGGFMTPDERTAALIEGLKQAGVEQAAFFVTTGNLEDDYGAGGEARIQAYVDAGHVIANHSHSHEYLWNRDAAAYIADLDKAEAWLAGRPGKRPWYRFPYLDEGRDPARRDALRAALRERGLLNGYVTVDLWDWAIDDIASEAIREGRAIDRKALGELYVETIVRGAEFFDRTARTTLGRSPVHVLLLHETDLNALFIPDVVAGLQAAGWTIVPIDEAYRDPIAQVEPDTLYLGGGRVNALAAVAGRDPDDLAYERNNDAELTRLFEDRVIVKGDR
ncbi:MAG TPA: polysaccharide deacetylase family protein [Croceibacterium sp.]